MRAYVTGGTGFVGSNIVKVFAERHGADVHCPVHRFVPADSDGFTTEQLDLLDDAAVRASVAAFAPDVIVHSMILNDFAAMYADRDLAWRSYVGTTETLARAAHEAGAKLILVSTDWVFDGTQSSADEDTPPNPVNLYGVLKMASEQAALRSPARTAVARVSAVSGVHWLRDHDTDGSRTAASATSLPRSSTRWRTAASSRYGRPTTSTWWRRPRWPARAPR